MNPPPTPDALSDLADLSEVEVLERAEVCAEAARRAEVELLVVAYQWAVLHDPDRLDPTEAARPGRERSRVLGGDGVAAVTEFAAATLGARIGRTTYAAGRLIADAQDLRHRHPVLWGRVQAGEVRASYARHVCARTRDLPRESALHVDAEVAESADGRVPWSRFEAVVEGAIATADPQAARAREDKAREARFAKKLHEEAHGMASFMVRADVATIELIDAGVTALAARLAGADPESAEDERRVQAVALLVGRGLAEGASAEVTPVQAALVVHVSGDPAAVDTEGRPVPRVARVEGHGPVTEHWIREVLGPRARFTVRPVLDPLGQVPVDAYEIPARHRRAVQLLTPADCFPWGSALATAREPLEIDHTIPYDTGPPGSGPPGQSRVGNYSPMTRTHHRVKTFGRWQVQQPFPSIFVWRDPHGGFYLVDHTGTRRIDQPRPRTGPARVVHLHHPPYRIDLTQDYTAA